MAFSVLIVEDEQSISSIIQEFLEDFDIDADIAENGKDALAKISEKNYNSAIIDLGLPDMNGETVIAKAFEINQNTKYFIHTGDKLYELPERMLAIGVDSSRIIFKPVTDLFLIYNKICEKK